MRHCRLIIPSTPGNVIYQWCFPLVLDDVWSHYLWNEQTCGDIIEAMLGLPVVYPCCLAAVRFASWWDKLCYDVVKFCQASQYQHVYRGDRSFDAWLVMLTSCMPYNVS